MTKAIIILVVLYVLLFIVSPVLTIWSLNTLFNLEIVVTLKTWLATAILCSIVYGSTSSKNG